nr:amidohydrolase family protein [Sphaerochaetaceae bacterium]
MGTTLIKNGLLVTSQGEKRADILIVDNKIAYISENLDVSLMEEAKTIDATGLYVMPGLIDAHTHYHLVSRGTVTADSFIEGSRLAAFGGVTTVVDFADDNKVSLKKSSEDRVSEMQEMAIDFALHQGVYKYRDSLEKELEDIKKLGVGTIKLFTTYRDVGYLVEDREELKKVFSLCGKLGLMVSVHCEDDEVITSLAKAWEGTYFPKDHADLRPSEAEAKGIQYVGDIAYETGCPLYVVHLSSKAGLEVVRKLRERGGEVIVETTPHYLFLDRKKLEGAKGALYVMTPPLRTSEDNKALQEALVNGEIQVVATDHCSFTYEQKLTNPDVRKTYPGIPGTEELLPMLHTLVDEGRITINDVVRLVSENPAKFFGLYPRKGSLEEGSDADLIL